MLIIPVVAQKNNILIIFCQNMVLTFSFCSHPVGCVDVHRVRKLCWPCFLERRVSAYCPETFPHVCAPSFLPHLLTTVNETTESGRSKSIKLTLVIVTMIPVRGWHILSRNCDNWVKALPKLQLFWGVMYIVFRGHAVRKYQKLTPIIEMYYLAFLYSE